MAETKIIALSATQSTEFALVNENGAARVIVMIDHGGTLLAGAFAPPLGNSVMGTHGVAHLVDARGTIIAHPDATRLGENVAQQAGIAQVMRGESGATFHPQGDVGRAANGAELVVGYAPIPPTGWGLVIKEPWADVVAPMFQYAVLLPLVLSLVAIVALGAAHIGIRNVHHPMQKLAQAANRIAFGDYHAAEQSVGGIREIEELRETLD